MSSLNLAALPQEAVERIASGCLLGAPDRAEFVLNHLHPHDWVCSRWNLVFLSATALRKTRSEAAFSAEELAADALPSAGALRAALVEELYRCRAEADGVSVEEVCKSLSDRTATRWELIRVLQERNAALEVGAETIGGVPRQLAAAPPPCPAVPGGAQSQASSVAVTNGYVQGIGDNTGSKAAVPQPEPVAHAIENTQPQATNAAPLPSLSSVSSASSVPSVVKEKCSPTESTPTESAAANQEIGVPGTAQANKNVCPTVQGPAEIFAWSPEDLDQKIPPSEHFWHGLLAPRKVTLLYSRAKLGKSYLTFGLLSAVWKGAAFLGRPTKALTPGAPPGVVYLTEEDADTLKLKHRHFAFPASAPICFLPKRELPYSKFTFEESLKTGFELVRARGAKLLVLDTLSSWAGVEAGAEHFAARAEVLMKILKDGASDTGAAVLVLHHATKRGKELRGSSALEASPDALVRLSSPYEATKLRTLNIKTRLVGERIEPIHFQEDGPGYTVTVESKECELKRLLEFIPPQAPGISVNELIFDTEMRRSWIYEALGMLQVQGLIVLKEGNGTRYFPARIWKIDPKQSA